MQRIRLEFHGSFHLQLRFRFHRYRFRIRRKRYGPSIDRKRLQSCSDGDGPALDAGESAPHQLVVASLVLAAESRLCAASSTCGSSATSPSCTAAPSVAVPSPMPAPCCAPPDKVWDSGSWSGLADWKSEMPQHYDTASRMLGVIENRILGPADHLLRTALPRRSECGRHLLSHPRCDLPVAGGTARCDRLTRSILRRRGSGAHYLQRLRRLHDGLPSRRQEHSRPELSVSRREARSAGFRRNQGSRCASAGWRSPKAAPDTKSTRCKSTACIRPAAAAFHLSRSSFLGVALGTMELLFHLKEKARCLPSAINWASMCAPIPSR